jgi:lactate permease
LGFPALAAVMVSLIANTTPISFGTVGVPTILGLGSTLNTSHINEAITKAGMTYPGFVYQIGLWTAILHSIMAIFIPLITVSMMTKFFGKNKTFKEGLQIWPYAIWAGFCFVVPFLLTAWLLGPEFPTIFGGLIGLFILLPSTKAGFLVPREKWDFPEKGSWEKEWLGTITISNSESNKKIPLYKAWLPYVLVGLLLVLTRVDFLPFKKFLKQFPVLFNQLFGTEISLKFDPVYNPGIFPFIAVSLLSILIFNMNKNQIKGAWKEAATKIKSPVIALLFTVPMVEVMQVDHSPQGWESMPIVIAHFTSTLFQGAWPIFAPFIGAFGALITGSNTVSNMLFGILQYSVADRLNISHIIILSLQNVGGAFGVLICVFKIIAASATVGLDGKEGLLIRRTAIPMIIYGLVVGIAGFLLVYYIVPGLF